MQIREAIKEVIERRNLNEEQAFSVAREIMSGETTPTLIAALLVGLRMKGETVQEISGFVRAMREKATPLGVSIQSDKLVDPVGTGGDGAGTFNISTVSAFVAAAAGCHIAKHGNRSISSKSGSADVLQSLGANIELPPEVMARCVDDIGIGFMFAPLYHKAMKHAIGPRRELGIRTIFNVLGPLTNPAGAKRQLIGVFSADLTEPLANVLKGLGSLHCMIVHGEDGLDEITVTGKTKVSELKNGEVVTYTISPEDFGLSIANPEALLGAGPEENARIARQILAGELGAKRDIVTLNAGATIYVSGLVETLEEGIKKAQQIIDSGEALQKLESFVDWTSREGQ